MNTVLSPRRAQHGAPSLHFSSDNPVYWQIFTAFALVGIAFGFVVAQTGLPVTNLHGPLYDKGLVGPTCGVTRATRYFFAGDFAMAMRFNPAIVVIVGGAIALVARHVYGTATGRWLNLSVPNWRHPAVVAAAAIVAFLVLALWMRQLLYADFIISNPT